MPHLLSLTQLTFADVLKRLTHPPRSPDGSFVPNERANGSCPQDSGKGPLRTNRETKPLPEMRGGESHRLYAIHILAGVPHKVVCQELNIKPRTAEDWRSELQRSVSEYLGRDVDYHFAARFLLDGDVRKICDYAVAPN